MDFLEGIGTIELGSSGVADILKLLFLVLVIGYLIYVFLLILRVRILADTVKTPNNNTSKLFSYALLLVGIVGSALAVILILLG
ncbi:hypothetical protein IT417_03845 [bacterium]|nr:hypothetical protein [bacterium]